MYIYIIDTVHIYVYNVGSSITDQRTQGGAALSVKLVWLGCVVITTK